MAERVFVDTNVFVYADDDDAGARRDRARAVLAELIPTGRAVISTQVLQEYFVVAVKKLGLAPERARRRVEALAQLDLVLVQPELILGAIDLSRLHDLSFWDALVVRCAAAAGCARLLTQDLNPGQLIQGVRVENPFAAPPSRARERAPEEAPRGRRMAGRAAPRRSPPRG
ncbi:MAG TPA: PIN domain-containing protein [Polyangia bacterium]